MKRRCEGCALSDKPHWHRDQKGRLSVRKRLQHAAIAERLAKAKAAGEKYVKIGLLKLRQETDTRIAIERERADDTGRRAGRKGGRRAMAIEDRVAAALLHLTGERRTRTAKEIAERTETKPESVLRQGRRLRRAVPPAATKKRSPRK